MLYRKKFHLLKKIFLVTHYLFFGVFVGREQINRLHMSKINIMPQKENKQQLAHVFLLLVTIQSFITFKLATYISQLLIYPFDLRLLAFT